MNLFHAATPACASEALQRMLSALSSLKRGTRADDRRRVREFKQERLFKFEKKVPKEDRTVETANWRALCLKIANEGRDDSNEKYRAVTCSFKYSKRADYGGW